jgi:hypothetical protein
MLIQTLLVLEYVVRFCISKRNKDSCQYVTHQMKREWDLQYYINPALFQ